MNLDAKVLLAQFSLAQAGRNERLMPENVRVVRVVRAGLPVGFHGNSVALVEFATANVSDARALDTSQGRIISRQRFAVLLKIREASRGGVVNQVIRRQRRCNPEKQAVSLRLDVLCTQTPNRMTCNRSDEVRTIVNFDVIRGGVGVSLRVNSRGNHGVNGQRAAIRQELGAFSNHVRNRSQLDFV